MREKRSLFVGFSFAAAFVAFCFAGCGSGKNNGSGFAPSVTQPHVSDGDGSADDATTSPGFGDDGGFVSLLLDGDVPDRAPPAVNCKLPGLWCYQTVAPCTTTMSGTVYDPAGKVPLSGVVVYVPADPTIPLDKIDIGTKSCSACTTKIANYMALAVTDVAGHFSMKGVPATTSVPVVVQVGK